ncbi:indole-3-glycerol phosphate synthase TrpC [Sphingomonas prati]|uniref:Indole-3-glycerol phosphate synthase n=1 Tax=Sphingomonas prati TaxID=1843237 RepID=A0A7W9F3M5_9SPHN|nr:indole-3-glycerol phosphate synthase TrpC [Sphingomonas prati]MBB5729994.1 indole-3-glycerol phosphate synthase [Sphingomonas prati]GGE90589.1 indole-3-glycerol phosphate synthase [Sphingomonas prati]
MSDRLREICATTRTHVAAMKTALPPSELAARIAAASPPRGFRAALDAKVAAGGYGLIAEIKKASPSKGLIRADFDPPAHARAYEAGGAACLSVLTDRPYFQGDDAYLVAARAAVTIPALRKDFMVDPWQVAEARALGADAILIIVAALDDAQMAEIESAAIDHGMDVLVEVHDRTELDRALALRSRLIGVNNRDLRDFSVDLARTEELAAHVPAGTTLVAESGIAGPADLTRLAAHGVRCFLVGETLMRHADVESATRALLTP